MKQRLQKIPYASILILLPILYLATLARSLVLGDPTEYTFVAHILGIAHPPGYAFITLVGKLFQTLIPFGEIPWRMHLLSATAATVAALSVYGTIRAIAHTHAPAPGGLNVGALAALYGALTVGTAVNFWQHAIHANPHVITAAFLAVNLFFLTKWWAEGEGARGRGGEGARGRGGEGATQRGGDETEERQGGKTATNDGKAIAPSPSRPVAQSHKWLYAFCFTAGLGVTHHPLTVFAWPGYALFILVVRPSLLREWRTLLKMVGLALLGLSVWLYFPIRSSMAPPFGPSTMHTLDGFLAHVLGRGLTEALTYYGPADLPLRVLVFWSILRLQYGLPAIFLALLGVAAPLLRERATAQLRPLAPILLYTVTFLGICAYVISLRAQDVMAYLLGPLLVVGLLAGLGLYALAAAAQAQLRLGRTPLLLLFGAVFLLGPLLQTLRNAPRISLRDYDEGQAYVKAVFTWFEGGGEGAVLLNEWERMTPLWYTQFVEQRWPDPADVRPLFVSTARTWLENVFDHLPGGPVYLSGFRPEIVAAGFRLRPAGPFFQVVEPGDESLPPWLTPVDPVGETLELVGFDLPQTAVAAGAYVPLTLAMRAPQGTADFYVPVLEVGDLTLPFTTDSHVTTPTWQPGEIIVERFDFALPHDLPAGDYPLRVGFKNLSRDTATGPLLTLGALSVTAQRFPIYTADLLANFRQRVGLTGALAQGKGQRAAAPWAEPLVARPGDTFYLTLRWKALTYAEESYTVFVHLIDLGNRPLVELDYTPLGGATPTHLWIPKWLPGQQFLDPYRLTIPADLAPGTYLIEVGLYEMTGKRRLHISDAQGNLAGDRYILGAIQVE